MSDAANGIEHPTVIDLVSRGKDGAHYSLIMVASGPWDDDKVLALQAKTKSYLSYVEQGQFLRMYPDADGKPLFFHLSTVHPLSQAANPFVDLARRHWLEALGIGFKVEELEP
jgi:hypothetical protein